MGTGICAYGRRPYVAMSVTIENKIVIPSSFLFWLACSIHCATGYPYPFAWWVELLLWGAFLASFAAIAVYVAREAAHFLES